MKGLRFEHLKTDVESAEKVLVTVEMNTSNREESLDVVRGFVKQAIEEVASRNQDPSAQEWPASEGWGGEEEEQDDGSSDEDEVIED